MKFYRPGRWNRAALEDEHCFLLDCAAAEIPVVAPVILENGTSIGMWEEIYFTLFPKRAGREMMMKSDEVWYRLGSLIGRMHAVGLERDAQHRLVMHPETTTIPERDQLVNGGWMSDHISASFRDVVDRIIEIALPLFDEVLFASDSRGLSSG